MTATKEAIAQVLNGVIDPNTGKGLQDSGEIASVLPGAVIIELGYPAKSQIELIKKAAEDALRAAGIDSEVEVRQNIRAHKVRSTLRVLPNVKNIIAVSSGKGGVGKSTVTANLALALASEGAKVGVLDADIYGPSQPTMLGASGTPQSKDGKTMEPIEANGLQINSIGFMVNPADPVIWRGPMVSSALRDLLQQTNWHDLDYLVIDMPPGTGDVPLTVFQSLPVEGIVIVSSPQDLVRMIVMKAYKMAQMMSVPVLGIVENYSYLVCPDCGKKLSIFGESHIDEIAAEIGVPVLGKMPIHPEFAELVDEGRFAEVDNTDIAKINI